MTGPAHPTAAAALVSRDVEGDLRPDGPASHHDDLYRLVNRLDPPATWSSWLGLGGPGRVATVLPLAAAGGIGRVGGLWALAALLGILYLVLEPLRVLREVRAAPTPAPEVTGG